MCCRLRGASQTADVSAQHPADPRLNPYVEWPAGFRAAAACASAMRELFEVLSSIATRSARVTFWGVTDGDSWRNDWPVRGRTSYPLLFDRPASPSRRSTPSSARQVGLLRSSFGSRSTTASSAVSQGASASTEGSLSVWRSRERNLPAVWLLSEIHSRQWLSLQEPVYRADVLCGRRWPARNRTT